MAEDRVTTALRLRRSMLRALDEAADLQGGISRETLVHLLLRDALVSLYERLGIETDPAVMAGNLVRVLGDAWASELSDEEITAFATVREALTRIAQIRTRDA